MATVSELLDIARADLGYKESPAGSNNTKYGEWYGLNGQPWCMMAVQYWFYKAGVKLPIRTASCGALMRAAQSAGCWVTKGYQPGDVVIYDFPGGAATDHCGIVESVDGTYISAIEGNTSSASDADGGAVERRARKFAQIVGAVRPSYDKEVDEVRYNTVEECPSWARETIQKLVDKEYLNGTGEGLDLSADMVRLLVILDRAGAFN